jgi:integrase/recombinase XerD
MIALRDAVADYLTIRRALGFKLVEHQRLLYDFATFLEQAGASTITTELAVAWAVRCRGTEGWKAARLSVARGFASYLRTIDPGAEIPATGILIARKHYATPYLYSDQEIGRLLAAAAALRPPLRAASHYTLFGLIAVAGMRIGEALRLDRDDVDLDSGVLTIRNTKFGKSRQLPLHRSTTAALARYDRTRDELCPRPRSPTFFVSTRGNRMDKSAVQKAFRDLCRRSGIARPRGSPQPRVHDLRHAFAVQTLLDWHRAGVDVQARMLWLSTYLGHVEPSDTYRYLTAAPELLALAAKRLETTLGDLT